MSNFRFVQHQQMRYCKIRHCENFRGTASKKIRFFRVPVKGEFREKWVEQIRGHQEFKTNDTYGIYLLCELHFDRQKIKIQQSGRVGLQKGAIPIFFPKIPSNEGLLAADPFTTGIRPEITIRPKVTTCQECFRAKCEISLASGKLISLENRLKQQSPKIHLIDHLQERYRSEKCFERQRKIITDSLLDKHQISPKMAEILKGRPINPRLIDDSEATENDSKPPDDTLAADFALEFANIDEQNQPKALTPSTNGSMSADDTELPKCEREQFAKYILSSLNQLPDKKALQAMMGIKGFMKNCQNTSSPEIEQ